jgi:hypothetical protein
MEEDYHEGSQEVTTLKERVNLGELQGEARKTLREVRVHLISLSPHCHTAALLLSSLIAPHSWRIANLNTHCEQR